MKRFLAQLREQRRLEQVAKERGFSSSDEMLIYYYVEEGWSLYDLHRELDTPMLRLRKRLGELKIEMRPRGGPNNVKVHINDELLEEAIRDGIPSVAERTGVTPQLLYWRLKDYYLKRQQQ